MQGLGGEVPVKHHGSTPDSLLSPLLQNVPWLRLHALGGEAPPRWLCVGGFGSRTQVLNGTYELLTEAQWGTRPAWQRMRTRSPAEANEFTKFIFFWPETGHWVIGPELHYAHSALARNGPGRWMTESPDRCPGRWACLNGATFEEDPRPFCRRQRTAAGGVEQFSLASPRRSPRASRQRSPRQSFGSQRDACGYQPPLAAASAGSGSLQAIAPESVLAPPRRTQSPARQTPGRGVSPPAASRSCGGQDQRRGSSPRAERRSSGGGSPLRWRS